jgi:hypothetical protein
MRYYKVSLLIILISGCLRHTDSGPESISVPTTSGNNNHIDTLIFQNDTLLSFVSFTIKVPSGWRNANDDTIPKLTDATSRHRLHNRNNKLINIETGLGTWDITYATSTDPEIYRRSYQKLSGFKALIFEPCCNKKGYHGVFIDSVGQIAGYAAGLCIYSKDLNTAENSELKEVINTIKIKADAFR